MNAITHVLLAGDKDYTPFLLEGRNKCLLDFSGRKLVDLTLAAFASASEVNRLLVVGPPDLRPLLPQTLGRNPLIFLPQTSSLSENVGAALKIVEKRWPGSLSVFVTNDAPLITSTEIDHFAKLAAEQNADINIAISRLTVSQLSDPLVQQYVRSMVVLSDGLYLLANQVALSSVTAGLLPMVQRLFDLRKQSRFTTELRTLGYAFLETNTRRALVDWVRLITVKNLWMLTAYSELSSQLSVSLPDVESGLNRLFSNDKHVRINEVPHALGCFDADTPSQLKELRRIVTGQVELSPHLEVAHA